MAFLKIAITAEQFLDNEPAKIRHLLDSGIDFVHIRKPRASKEELRCLISCIPSSYHPRLKLNDHFELIDEFELGGVHLNSRNPAAPAEAKSISRSFHNLDELEDCARYDYVTLSPIFDSISKIGYRSAFNLDKLKDKIENKNVIALGGVTPDTFPILRDKGFVGGAMLGCVWRDVNEFCKQL